MLSVMDWPPHSQTSTLLKQCVIILSEKRTKDLQHPKKSFGCPSRSLQNYSPRLLKEIPRKLPKRIQTMLKNKYGYTFKQCFLLPSMFACFNKLLYRTQRNEEMTSAYCCILFSLNHDCTTNSTF